MLNASWEAGLSLLAAAGLYCGLNQKQFLHADHFSDPFTSLWVSQGAAATPCLQRNRKAHSSLCHMQKRDCPKIELQDTSPAGWGGEVARGLVRPGKRAKEHLQTPRLQRHQGVKGGVDQRTVTSALVEMSSLRYLLPDLSGKSEVQRGLLQGTVGGSPPDAPQRHQR